MKIDLTKKQLKTLLELTYLGNWMINAHRAGDDDPILEEYDDMASFIYSKAGEAGLKEVKYSDKVDRWFPTGDFEMESEVTEFHDEYDNNIFWDELSDRLAFRDFEKTYGKKAIEKMSFEEICEKRSPFDEKYDDEFSNNALNRLIIDDAKSEEKIGRNESCTCGSGKKFKKCCGI